MGGHPDTFSYVPHLRKWFGGKVTKPNLTSSYMFKVNEPQNFVSWNQKIIMVSQMSLGLQ